MLHYQNTPKSSGSGSGVAEDMSVLGRQQADILKWQQAQNHLHLPQDGFSICWSDELDRSLFSMPSHSPGAQQFQSLINIDPAPGLADHYQFSNRALKPDPETENVWPDFSYGYGSCEFGSVSGFEMNYEILRTASCPSSVAAAMAEVALAATDTKSIESVSPDNLNSTVAKESFKKRKSDKAQNVKINDENDDKQKKCKNAEEGDSRITDQISTNNESSTTTHKDNKETSNDTSKENYKVSEVQKPDYIHVRARRGQATDSHSLAERVRREKISERMKYLQDLVPGCNKITGKAGMLDEIINYVQSLQRQVEFLSMKLAAVNPRLDLDIDNLFAKEMLPACSSTFPVLSVASEMANSTYFQYNPLHQVVTCCGLEMGINPPDVALRRSVSAPVSVPEAFLDASCFTQIQPSPTWDADLQNLYNMEFQQRRSLPFPSQQYIGRFIDVGNQNTEM